MYNIVSGKALVIPEEHVNADMAMGWYLGMDALPPEEIVLKFMSGIDPAIATIVQKGDIMVCGRNFGFGKVHGTFWAALKVLEIKCIVAESFSTQLFQGAMMQGVYLVECPGVLQKVSMRDRLEVDIESATLIDRSTNITIEGKKLPKYCLDVMMSGGHVGYLMQSMVTKQKLRREYYDN